MSNARRAVAFAALGSAAVVLLAQVGFCILIALRAFEFTDETFLAGC